CPRATTAHIAPPSAARIPVSLHDALPICMKGEGVPLALMAQDGTGKLKRLVLTLHLVEPQHRAELFHGVGVLLPGAGLPRQEYRSEEYTSELQSRFDLVCRLLLHKKQPDL